MWTNDSISGDVARAPPRMVKNQDAEDCQAAANFESGAIRLERFVACSTFSPLRKAPVGPTEERITITNLIRHAVLLRTFSAGGLTRCRPRTLRCCCGRRPQESIARHRLLCSSGDDSCCTIRHWIVVVVAVINIVVVDIVSQTVKLVAVAVVVAAVVVVVVQSCSDRPGYPICKQKQRASSAVSRGGNYLLLQLETADSTWSSEREV